VSSPAARLGPLQPIIPAGPGVSGKRAWLSLRVHLDAVRFDPLGYLQAVAWRIRGFRLRSRHRFAALAGRSPHAYRLWVAKHEPGIRLAYGSEETVAAAPILVAIDCLSGSEGTEDTLQSLNGLNPVIVGSAVAPGVRHVAGPAELADLISFDEAWLCILSPGDKLADGALDAYGKAVLRAPEASLIYADDDLIGNDGRRTSPHFKPAWNPELFERHDFVSGAAVLKVRREELRRAGPGTWPEDLVRTAIGAGQPVHLPLVLHHRRKRPLPALRANSPLRSPDPLPSVTVIIPTRNQRELLQICIEGVQGTNYPGLNVVVVDNGSNEPDATAYLDSLKTAGITILRMPGPFNFSSLNNEATRTVDSKLLCFLNNDVEMIDADWLQPLVARAMRPDIGAVGAQLLYPDRTIQHAGVFTGIGGGAGHAHRFQAEGTVGYFQRANLPQRVAAVTAACLVVDREKFLAVGGFDETLFPVAFNDVDLCLKLNQHGWQSFYEPQSKLIHHESKSRGSDRAKLNRDRFAGELAALKRKWGTDIECDPYHHPHLSPFCEQFCVAV
jgi:GT2 family glycosyltransferase